MRFADRADAGRHLASRLERLRDARPVVLGLARDGVAVADQVAEILDAPLDVLVVRKLAVPLRPGLAMGAIGESGVRVLDQGVVAAADVPSSAVEQLEWTERIELDRQVFMYRNGRPAIPLHGRCAIIVDDGIATGSTALAATQVARRRGASRVVIAVPVGSPRTLWKFRAHVDQLVCVIAPRESASIGQSYVDFTEMTDGAVIAVLQNARRRQAAVLLKGAPSS